MSHSFCETVRRQPIIVSFGTWETPVKGRSTFVPSSFVYVTKSYSWGLLALFL